MPNPLQVYINVLASYVCAETNFHNKLTVVFNYCDGHGRVVHYCQSVHHNRKISQKCESEGCLTVLRLTLFNASRPLFSQLLTILRDLNYSPPIPHLGTCSVCD